MLLNVGPIQFNQGKAIIKNVNSSSYANSTASQAETAGIDKRFEKADQILEKLKLIVK